MIDGAARILKAKEARTDLRGNCSYGEADKPITSPCIHVTANLLDEAKKKIASTETNENGEFRFFIPSGKTYYVQVMDRKDRASYVNKKVGRGDSVSILLKP